MEIHESAEDYLEAILRLSQKGGEVRSVDIASMLSVSKPSVSHAMKLLREDLGYKGIILTDTLSVPAITDNYDSGEAAVNAISAGADMLLCPEDLEKTIEALREAVEENKLTEERIDESVARILTAKLRVGILE